MIILLTNIILFRIQDDENENPCFPTRNDRLAFINDHIVRERCVCLEKKTCFSFVNVSLFLNFLVQQILLEYLNKVLKHPKFRNHPATVINYISNDFKSNKSINNYIKFSDHFYSFSFLVKPNK